MNPSPLLLLLVLPVAASAVELGRPDLRSEEFNQRFAASFGVLSAREPQISEVEAALLAKLAPMIADQPDQAQSALESLLSDGKPVSAAFNHVLGNLYFMNGDWSRAEDQYRLAIEKFPDFQRAWNSLGTLKMEVDEYREAAEALSRSVELGANDAHTYGLLGYALLRARAYVAAEVAYNLALLRDPHGVSWLEGKARILSEAGRHAETLAATDELIAINPGNVEYWRLQANAHLALGKEREAARSLELARTFGPLDAGALFLLGNIYLQQGLSEQALDVYLTAIQIDPRHRTQPATLLRVAHSLVGRNQMDLARRLLNQLEPDRARWSVRELLAHATLRARLALHEGDTDGAVTALENALTLDPTNAECLYRLAVVHAEHDRSDQARFLLEKIKGEPDYEYGAQLYLARMHSTTGRFKEAMTYARNAYRLRPSAEMEALYGRLRVAAESQ